jgi:WD40 repeat protein
VGDDGFLRIWSLTQRRQVLCVQLPGMARAVDYSPDGNYLAVGLGGRVGAKNTSGVDGLVKVFRLDRDDSGHDLRGVTQVCEIKDAKQWISVVRFSPDGATLAVGSRDNSIYLYSVMNQYNRKGKFSKHNSGINQLDFSADGKYIQSNCRYGGVWDRNL